MADGSTFGGTVAMNPTVSTRFLGITPAPVHLEFNFGGLKELNFGGLEELN